MELPLYKPISTKSLSELYGSIYTWRIPENAFRIILNIKKNPRPWYMYFRILNPLTTQHKYLGWYDSCKCLYIGGFPCLSSTISFLKYPLYIATCNRSNKQVQINHWVSPDTDIPYRSRRSWDIPSFFFTVLQKCYYQQYDIFWFFQ